MNQQQSKQKNLRPVVSAAIALVLAVLAYLGIELSGATDDGNTTVETTPAAAELSAE